MKKWNYWPLLGNRPWQRLRNNVEAPCICTGIHLNPKAMKITNNSEKPIRTEYINLMKYLLTIDRVFIYPL